MKRFIKQFFPHRREYYVNRVLRRLTKRGLIRGLRNLGIEDGETIFVHTSLASLGYLTCGVDGVIEALVEVVGPEGTIAMPAFSTAGSMADYLRGNPTFDIRSTPSRVGRLTEVFRTWPGTVRSMHPTHSWAAYGKNADHLVAGHEAASGHGPCGMQSPFSKLAPLGAKMLRLGTPALTMVHHVQEITDCPNLFLPETATVACIDWSGRSFDFETKVYRKRIPELLFLGEDPSAPDSQSTSHRDVPLLYSGPDSREARLRRRSPEGARILIEIRNEFVERGWLTIENINGAVCELFDVQHWLDKAVTIYTRTWESHRERYDLEKLERFYESGGYP